MCRNAEDDCKIENTAVRKAPAKHIKQYTAASMSSVLVPVVELRCPTLSNQHQS